MSYTKEDATIDWLDEVQTALAKRDGDHLYRLAEMVDEEDAQPLLATIKRWNAEDWAYDESIGN